MVLYFSSVAALFMQKRKNVEIQINLYTSYNEIVLGLHYQLYSFEVRFKSELQYYLLVSELE